MKTTFFIIFLCVLINSFLSFELIAQVSVGHAVAIPPSPDAGALIKYQQYPVTMSSGLVNINIPIYTIKTNKTEVPISISYHPSGIKVDEISSVVGLGWSLNAGGVITRSVRGLPDNKFGRLGVIHDKAFYDSLPEESKKTMLDQIYSMENQGTYDSESDVYSYNACGLSGSFRYDVNGERIEIPKTNNIIEYDDGLDQFTITKNDGTIYVFNNKETSLQGAQNGNNSPYPSYTSSWYLSSIKDINNQVISFDYESDPTVYTEYFEGWRVTACNYNVPNNIPYWYIPPSFDRTTTYSQSWNTQRLTKITFPSGYIFFNYLGDRADRRKYRLINVLVKNKTETVSGISLTQNYFSRWGVEKYYPGTDQNYGTHNHLRLKLDEVGLLDNTQRVYARYKLDYDVSKLLPEYNDNKFGGYDDYLPYYGQDLWGYYNGVQTNQSFLSESITGLYQVPVANRSVNSNYAQACILKKITFPTGGYTEYEYEGNKNNHGFDAGGLRIKTISTYKSQNSIPIKTSYQYENVLDNFNQESAPNSLVYSQGTIARPEGSDENFPDPPDWIGVVFDHYTSDPALPLTISNGCPVFYSKVTEYHDDGNGSNGKTIYDYLYSSDFQYNIDSYYPSGFKPRYFYVNVDHEWQRGQLSKKREYSKQNGVYKIVKSITYNYRDLNKSTKSVGFSCFENYGTIYPNDFVDVNTTCNNLFQPIDRIAQTGIRLLSEIQDSTYFTTGNTLQTTKYFYRQLDHQYEVSAVYTSRSDGSTLKSEYKYPNDLKSNSTPNVYNQMADRNILSIVVIKTDSVDNTFLKYTKTNYRSFGFGISLIVPETVEIKQGSNESEVRVHYDFFDDKGNITQITGSDGITTSYIWDSSKCFLMAEVKGATYSQISQYSGQAVDYNSSTLKSILNGVVPNALIQTFSYKPLVGMTSQTAPNGTTTYYYYNFGQLQEIKNDDLKLLKKFSNNYVTQTPFN